MSASLLESQFETLEEPDEAIEVDVSDSPEIIMRKIKSNLQHEI